VTLDQAKLQIRQDISVSTEEDLYITGLISTARAWCEQQVHQLFISQTWELVLDGWQECHVMPPSIWGPVGITGATIYTSRCGRNVVRLPYCPLQDILSVEYVDMSGETQTWDASYWIAGKGKPGRLAPRQNRYFPQTADQIDTVTIRFQAGYGDSPEDVPPQARHAILMMVPHLYENRCPVGEVRYDVLPFGLESLLDSISHGAELFA